MKKWVIIEWKEWEDLLCKRRCRLNFQRCLVGYPHACRAGPAFLKYQASGNRQLPAWLPHHQGFAGAAIKLLNLGWWRDSLERRQELEGEIPLQFESPERVLSQFQRKAPDTKSGAWPEPAHFLEAFGVSVGDPGERYIHFGTPEQSKKILRLKREKHMLHRGKTPYQEEHGESEVTNDEVSETLPQTFYKRRLLKNFQMDGEWSHSPAEKDYKQGYIFQLFFSSYILYKVYFIWTK